MFAGLRCSNVAYADDTTIYVIIPKPSLRALYARLLTEDLIFIKAWCRQWRMQLNPGKTKSIIFSRSRTANPIHPDLSLGEVLIENVEYFKLLGVIFDSKLTFELHLRQITSIVSQKVGIIRKCWQVYRDNSLILKCFYSFLLAFFEYCSAVWMSAAPTHLQMLDRVFNSVKFLLPTDVKIEHRRTVAAVCILYKIFNKPEHPLYDRLPGPACPIRPTRRAQQMNSRACQSLLSRNSVQFNRSFLPSIIEIWNFHPQEIVDAQTMGRFKSLVYRFLLTQ